MMIPDTTPRPHRHPVRHVLRRVAVAAALIATLGTAAACSTAESATLPPTGALPADALLIDVRTPAEFAEGHLEGAINIPVELPTFTAQVAQLDPEKAYLVYCRTGRRADIAIESMDALGLRTTNLGSVEAASETTGVPVVR